MPWEAQIAEAVGPHRGQRDYATLGPVVHLDLNAELRAGAQRSGGSRMPPKKAVRRDSHCRPPKAALVVSPMSAELALCGPLDAPLRPRSHQLPAQTVQAVILVTTWAVPREQVPFG